MCREELFQKEDDVELEAILRIFRRPGFALDNFDIPRALELEVPHIEPATSDMIPMILALPEDVTTRIDRRLASPALVLAGNTAIAIESVSGHPLSEEHLADFRHIVKAVYTFLESKDGEKMQVR